MKFTSSLFFLSTLAAVQAFAPRSTSRPSTSLPVDIASASAAVSDVGALGQQVSPDTLPAVIAAGFTAVAGAVGAVVSKGGAKTTKVEEVAPEPEPEPIDVSIPYDSTFMLAYEAALSEEASFDQAQYDQFKTLYEQSVVADVTAKKYARDAARYQAAVDKLMSS